MIANIGKRLASSFYDALLCLSILFFATLPALWLNQGQAFGHTDYVFQFYLLAVSFLYYAGSWVHGGQTVGLKAWKLKVVSENGQRISWSQALIRFVAAIISITPFGLGFLWMAVDRERLTWHDRLSKSKVIYLPR